jgi:DNA polymerase-3 subunit epsilon
MKITCIDFETANASRGSACSVGIAVIANGEIVESHEKLIKPHISCGYFDPFNTSIHGITARDVRDAKEYNEIALWMHGFFQADMIVAHNAAFDMSVLRAVMNLYAVPFPEFHYFCTYKAASRVWPDLHNHKLDTVSSHIGHRFKHHNAEADAEAAGRVLLAMLKDSGKESPRDLAKSIGMKIGRIYPGGYKPCSVSKAKRKD